MKKFYVLFFGILLIASCSRHSSEMAISADEISHQISSGFDFDKDLSVENVKFDYDKNVFNDLKSSIVEASPLENKDDKPDYVQSRNVHFSISYANSKKSPAEISVFNVEEYKKAFSLEPNYVEMIAKDFADLRQAIDNSGKLKSFGADELPYVPNVDAHQEFYAKAKVINFRNGKGLLFLTQFSQDVSIINNERLIYLFQGLTDDREYFIHAEFPVSSEGLPSAGTDSFENYKIPANFYGAKYEENKKANKKYREKIALKLQNLKDEKFAPDLSRIESLLSSIKIN